MTCGECGTFNYRSTPVTENKDASLDLDIMEDYCRFKTRAEAEEACDVTESCGYISDYQKHKRWCAAKVTVIVNFIPGTGNHKTKGWSVIWYKKVPKNKLPAPGERGHPNFVEPPAEPEPLVEVNGVGLVIVVVCFIGIFCCICFNHKLFKQYHGRSLARRIYMKARGGDPDDNLTEEQKAENIKTAAKNKI